MGAWGAGILQDDSAMDIIDEYRILLGYKVPNDEAYQLVKDYFYPDFKGADNEDIFWFALAIYQLRNGILMDEVKENALKFLDDPQSLDVWKESGERIYKNRIKVLEKLRQEILNPSVTKPKRIPKPPKYYSFKSEFKEGDLILVEIQDDWLEEKSINYIGKYFLMRVVRIKIEPVSKLKPELDYGTSAMVAIYKWIGNQKPFVYNLTEIELLKEYNLFQLTYCDEQIEKYCSVIDNNINYKGKGDVEYFSGRLGRYPSLVSFVYNIFEELRVKGEKFEALGD